MGTTKKRLVLVAACALAAAVGVAGALPTEALRRIDAYLADYARSTPVPGFSAVVVADGRIAFAKGYGVERLGAAKPMSAASSSAVGSLTKSFTALAVMQLVEQGKVDLDAPVVAYLPWFRTMDVAESAAITVRMLLANSSGLPSDTTGAWLDTLADDPGALERGVRALAGASLQRRGGAAFEYSNMGFNVAGAIVERVSGLPYAEYLQRFIFDPLGMSRSTTSLARFDALGVLHGHFAGIDRATPAGPSFVPGMLAAGSELRCSAEDLGRYLGALLNGGTWQGRRVASALSIEQLWTPASSFQYPSSRLAPEERTWSYGMGWFISTVEGRTLVHHGGNRLTMSSYAVIDPRRKTAAAILLNVDALDPYRFVQPATVVNNLLHLAAGEAPTDFMVEKRRDPTANAYEPPPGDLGQYAGEYLSRAGDSRIAIARDGGRLVVRLAAAGRRDEGELDFATPVTAYVRSISGSLAVTFRSTPEGRITGLELAGFGGFLRQPADALAGYRRVRVPGPSGAGPVSVMVPASWAVEEAGGVLGAVAPDGLARITVRLSPIRTAAGTAEPGSSPTVRYELLAGRPWRERTGAGADGRRLLVADATVGGLRLTATLEAPADALTAAARDALLPLLSGTREE
jgi:CubicO group peptidase (beta-lactamase class C family)